MGGIWLRTTGWCPNLALKFRSQRARHHAHALVPNDRPATHTEQEGDEARDMALQVARVPCREILLAGGMERVAPRPQAVRGHRCVQGKMGGCERNVVGKVLLDILHDGMHVCLGQGLDGGARDNVGEVQVVHGVARRTKLGRERGDALRGRADEDEARKVRHALARRGAVHAVGQIDLLGQERGLRQRGRDDRRGVRIEEQDFHARHAGEHALQVRSNRPANIHPGSRQQGAGCFGSRQQQHSRRACALFSSARNGSTADEVGGRVQRGAAAAAVDEMGDVVRPPPAPRAALPLRT